MHNQDDVAFERKCYRLGLWLVKGNELFWQEGADGMALQEIRIKGPQATGRDYLVIVKSRIEGQKMVGFQSGETLEDAVQGALRKVEERTMKWREDRPYQEE